MNKKQVVTVIFISILVYCAVTRKANVNGRNALYPRDLVFTNIGERLHVTGRPGSEIYYLHYSGHINNTLIFRTIASYGLLCYVIEGESFIYSDNKFTVISVSKDYQHVVIKVTEVGH